MLPTGAQPSHLKKQTNEGRRQTNPPPTSIMSNCVGDCKNPAQGRDATAPQNEQQSGEILLQKGVGGEIQHHETEEARHGDDLGTALWDFWNEKRKEKKNVSGVLLIFSLHADFYINRTGFSLTAALITQLKCRQNNLETRMNVCCRLMIHITNGHAVRSFSALQNASSSFFNSHMEKQKQWCTSSK